MTSKPSFDLKKTAACSFCKGIASEKKKKISAALQPEAEKCLVFIFAKTELNPKAFFFFFFSPFPL